MLINSKTQLGISISESDEMQLKIIATQVANLRLRAPYVEQQELDAGIKNVNELVLNDLNYRNNNFLVRATAMQMVEKIPLNEKFDIKFLRNLPMKKATFLLGGERAFRYYRTQDNVYAVFFGLNKGYLSWRFLRIDLVNGDILIPKLGAGNSDEAGFVPETNALQENEFQLFVKLLLFVELSELSVEVLTPNKKIGTRREGKFFNQSHSNITLVDSKWNVISVRTEGFTVSGHWRMQPHGADRTQRRLIWVDTFEKKGYIRKPKLSTPLNLS
jgi:hypothetical protein